MFGKKIIIISEGSYGSTTPSDYHGQAQLIGAYLEFEKVEFEILEKAEEADCRLKNGDIKAIIFVSRGQIKNAQKIHETHPEVTVIIHTGSFPENGFGKGIHAFEKADSDQMKEMINLATA